LKLPIARPVKLDNSKLPLSEQETNAVGSKEVAMNELLNESAAAISRWLEIKLPALRTLATIT